MLESGQVVDRFTVDKLLGRGGMAVVYRVRHNSLGSLHALKVLTLSSPTIRERLLQEGRVQASLRHPNVVAVTDVLDIGEGPALVMEYVDGPALDDWLQANRPPHDVAEALFRGVLAAVEHAHAVNVIHRDLKPANVLLQPSSGVFIPKVADFGLAKAFDGEQLLTETRSGVAMGTPAYMAPEQIRNAKHVDQRADLFSLGCLLFELMCGRPPFSGPDILSIFNAVASGSFPPPESLAPDMPVRVHAAIHGLLQVDPSRRIQSCVELRKVLDGSVAAGSVRSMHLPPVRGGDTWVPGLTLGTSGIASAEGPAVGPTLELSPSPSPSPGIDASLDGSLAPSDARSPSTEVSRSRPPAETAVVRKRLWLGVAVVGGLVGVIVTAIVALVVIVWGVVASWSQGVERWLATHTGGEVVYDELLLRPGAIGFDNLRVLGRDGNPVFSAQTAWLRGDPQQLKGERLAVDVVELQGVRLDLRRDGKGWILPTRTLALLRGDGDALSIDVGSLTTGPVVVTVPDVGGDLVAQWEQLKLDGLSRSAGTDGTWSTSAARLDDLTVNANEPLLHLGGVAIEGGVTEIDDLEVWLLSESDGTVRHHSAIVDRLPVLFGGGAPASTEPYAGLDLGWLPGVRGTEVEVRSGALWIADAVDGRSARWMLDIDHGKLGPVHDGVLPIYLQLRAGGGRLDLDGSVDEAGLVAATVDVTRFPLKEVGTYLDADLDRLGLDLADGTLEGSFDLSAAGDTMLVSMDVTARGATFAPRQGAVSRTTQRLLGPRDVGARAETGGELGDRTFTPVDTLLGELSNALLEPSLRARGPRTWGDAPGHKRPDQAQAPDADPPPADAETAPQVPLERRREEILRARRDVERVIEALKKRRGGER